MMSGTKLVGLKTNTMRLLLALSVFMFLFGCNQPQKQETKETTETAYKAVAPEWSKNVNIYEVNIRQFTPEGTIKAFESHLPRLKNMGVDILWLMPIHPIGEKNRKGTLGSYYAVKDYKAVNPEFGTMDDFKSFVNTAHEMGFKVILDWVANHTAWDNQWIYDNPEWYTMDSLGNMIAPFDWTDVADLNYDEEPMRDAMMDALKFWVAEADIDGYRCDVASMVPVDFWERVRYELDQIKPVFMLAEAEETNLHNNSFDMTYAWDLHHHFNEIAKGEKNADDLEAYFVKYDTLYPFSAYRMTFITNHDENSWNGTVNERMGEGARMFAVLSYTLPGMPLIYSGQEVGLDKRLEFFEKDEINWDLSSPWLDFYTSLNTLKKDNPAFWNGAYGGTMERIATSESERVFAFTRTKDDNAFFILTNLTADLFEVQLYSDLIKGQYMNVATGEMMDLENGSKFDMESWDYMILKKQ